MFFFGRICCGVSGAGRSESLTIKPAKELYVDSFHVLVDERANGRLTAHLLGQVCGVGTLRYSQMQDVPILSFGLVDVSGCAIKVIVFGDHAESVEVQARFAGVTFLWRVPAQGAAGK